MLRSAVQTAVDNLNKAIAELREAKTRALADMFNGGRFGKRSLAALAAGIGMTEPDTAVLIAAEFPAAERTTGRRTGKVYYGL